MQGLYPNSNSNARTKETLTAEAVTTFLRENKIPVLIENGGIYSISILGMGEVLNADFNSCNLTG
jgi:hypothetical protein